MASVDLMWAKVSISEKNRSCSSFILFSSRQEGRTVGVFRLLALSGQDLSRFGANQAGSLSFLKCLTQA